MSATAKAIIKWALSQVGYRESPPGSNKTKYGKAYGLNGQPWCAIFIWADFNANKANALYYGGKKTAYCPELWRYYKAHKQAFKDIKKAKPGDLVFFDWNGNGTPEHVGIVYKNPGGGYIKTVEGNTSTSSNDNGGRVMKRKRHKSVILGFARPKYKKPKRIIKKTDSKPEKKKIKKIDYKKLPVLKRGSRGKAVLYIQKKLRKKPDGIYGPATEKAVKNYQEKHGLTPDGIVGPNTWKKLIK